MERGLARRSLDACTAFDQVLFSDRGFMNSASPNGSSARSDPPISASTGKVFYSGSRPTVPLLLPPLVLAYVVDVHGGEI
jgi:hypothetical protein